MAEMRHVAEMLDRYAKTDEPILITGESGGVSSEWGDYAALANRSFWLACG